MQVACYHLQKSEQRSAGKYSSLPWQGQQGIVWPTSHLFDNGFEWPEQRTSCQQLTFGITRDLHEMLELPLRSSRNLFFPSLSLLVLDPALLLACSTKVASANTISDLLPQPPRLPFALLIDRESCHVFRLLGDIRELFASLGILGSRVPLALKSVQLHGSGQKWICHGCFEGMRQAREITLSRVFNLAK